jgi:hypothetical protein
MQKLVYTQSFSNFIEETYRLSTKMGVTEKPKEIIDLSSAEAQKSQIGFFRVNLEVMLQHSFRRLKKEQNKMIDHMVLKLYNVSFSNCFKFSLAREIQY